MSCITLAKKKIFKKNQSFNAFSIDRIEYIKKKAATDQNTLKWRQTWCVSGILVESYVLQDIIQVKTQGKLEGKEQLLKF